MHLSKCITNTSAGTTDLVSISVVRKTMASVKLHKNSSSWEFLSKTRVVSQYYFTTAETEQIKLKLAVFAWILWNIAQIVVFLPITKQKLAVLPVFGLICFFSIVIVHINENLLL